MARRKRGYLEEGYSSDSASSSASVDDDVQRQRRRRAGKEDAILGVFGDDDSAEREGGVGRTVRGVDRKGKKVDYLRGQAFVASQSIDVDAREQGAILTSASEDEAEVASSDEYSEAEQFARLPPTEEEEIETRNAFASAPTADEAQAKQDRDGPEGFRPASFSSSRGGIGSGRAGIGSTGGMGGIGSSNSTAAAPPGQRAAPTFTRGGIGTMPNFSTPSDEQGPSDLSRAGMPTFFGQNAAVQPSSAFGNRAPRPQSASSTPSISFKMGGKFDPAKYLAQMGWSGGGLGKGGEGIVNPIEVKQRPERAGIAFGGLKEKTKQAKEEARRRGETVSSDEDERRSRRKKEQRGAKKDTGRPKEAVPHAWTRAERKPRKPKVEHRTYEEILRERGHASGAGDNSVASRQVIVDASGRKYNSISDALAQHAVPSNDTSQLIEVRHNIRLICEGNKVALDRLANEGAAIHERRRWLERDRDESLRRTKALCAEFDKVRTVAAIVAQIEALGRKAIEDESVTLDAFVDIAQRVSVQFKSDIVTYGLDASIIGAMLPVFRRSMSHWSPLGEPTLLTNVLPRFKSALRISTTSVDLMTPYESLLWNVWMPPVRSALSNEWNVRHSDKATELFRAWQPLLPAFIRDNVTQQLILPKLRASVTDWDGKQPLFKMVFPWMPLLGTQMDDVVSEGKRQVRRSLKAWRVSKGIPAEMKQWRDVFHESEWTSMLLHQVFDKLSAHLEARFRVDPRKQDMRALDEVLAWRTLLGDKITSKLLLSGFVPMWIKTLHAWLTSVESNLEEVAQWYEQWRGYLHGQGVGELDGVRTGFQTALRMMEEALRLGSKRRSLMLPDIKAMQRGASLPSTDHGSARSSRAPSMASASLMGDEAGANGFRQLIEEAASEADLLVQPLNRTEARSGMPLYRISRSIDGKAGTTFYVDEDVVFAESRTTDGGVGRATYTPMSMNALIRGAGGGAR